MIKYPKIGSICYDKEIKKIVVITSIEENQGYLTYCFHPIEEYEWLRQDLFDEGIAIVLCE